MLRVFFFTSCKIQLHTKYNALFAEFSKDGMYCQKYVKNYYLFTIM